MTASVEDIQHSVALVICQNRFNFDSELELQSGIDLALQRNNIEFQREVRLGAGNRIDFLVPPGIGIEVKIGGSTSALIRQLHRYALRPEILGLVVVASRLRLNPGLDMIGGKPLHIIGLIGSLL